MRSVLLVVSTYTLLTACAFAQTKPQPLPQPVPMPPPIVAPVDKPYVGSISVVGRH